MKYEPQKVFILENGKYEELTYQEFFDHFESDGIYPKKYFIPLYGMLLEVDKNTYREFYRSKRRQKYLIECSKENGDFSYDMLTTDEFNGEDILVDESQNVGEEAVNRIMLDKLSEAIHCLSDNELEVIYALFYEELTEREYAERKGVYRNAVHKRKVRILAKLKKFMGF